MHGSKISRGTNDFTIVWTYLVREIHRNSKKLFPRGAFLEFKIPPFGSLGILLNMGA